MTDPRMATTDAPVTVEPVTDLIEMLQAGTWHGDMQVFDHTPDEFGLHVMENAAAILAALASAPAGDGVEAGKVLDDIVPLSITSAWDEAERRSIVRAMEAYALARPRAAVGERAEIASVDLAYTLGFSDARGLAVTLVWNQKEPFTREALCANIRAIVGPASEAGWDGAEMPLTLALEQIDGEAPATEPRDGPTVGFAPSNDPEHCDGNDIVEDAFREGVLRGRWEAADVARKAILALQSPPAKVE